MAYLNQITRSSVFETNKLIDVVAKHLRALEALGQNVKHWGILQIHLIFKSLDTSLLAEWKGYRSLRDCLTLEAILLARKHIFLFLEAMYDFLRTSADIFDRLENKVDSYKPGEKIFCKIKSFSGSTNNENI